MRQQAIDHIRHRHSVISRAGARARSRPSARACRRSGSREPGDRMRVAVEDVARPVAVDPRAQPLEADVGRVVGVVVDAQRRAVADQDVRGRQPLRELRGLLLRVVVRAAVAVAHAALEAGDGHPEQRRAAAVQVLDLDLAQQVGRVVVAVHADLRDREPGERLDPGAVEVARG